MIICHPVIQPSLYHPGYLLGVVFPWPVICLFGVVLTVRLACQALGGTEEGGKNVNIEGRKSVMKKWFYMLLVVSLLIAMAACGAEKTENMDDPPESQIAEPSVSEWTRAGYFGDENERHKRHSFMGRLAHHLRDHFLPFPEDEKADRGKRDRNLRGDLLHYR